MAGCKVSSFGWTITQVASVWTENKSSIEQGCERYLLHTHMAVLTMDNCLPQHQYLASIDTAFSPESGILQDTISPQSLHRRESSTNYLRLLWRSRACMPGLSCNLKRLGYTSTPSGQGLILIINSSQGNWFRKRASGSGAGRPESHSFTELCAYATFAPA